VNAPHDPGTEQLLQRVRQGDASAEGELLQRHRDRIKRMVHLRMDRRVARRLDPSDVVQETLIEAHRKLPQYAEQQPLPFYPWLWRLARERLIQLHRRHLYAKGRSVARELHLSDDSVMELAERLVAGGNSPSEAVRGADDREHVRCALHELPLHDKEILVMRFLEHMEVHEIAASLELTPGTVCTRQLRALRRLRKQLVNDRC